MVSWQCTFRPSVSEELKEENDSSCRILTIVKNCTPVLVRHQIIHTLPIIWVQAATKWPLKIEEKKIIQLPNSKQYPSIDTTFDPP
jgi:hypothetical protein